MRKRVGTILFGSAALAVGVFALFKRRTRRLPHHPFLAGRKPLVMAHQGGKGLWPANTLYAFEGAFALGVDVLEMDIHCSADGALVVRHDPSVDSTTDGAGFIRDLSLAELKALDAGYRWTADGGRTFPFRGLGITIPTLEEVLAAFPNTRLNIDIKPEDPAVVPLFAQMLSKYGRLENVLVGSFHNDQIRRFRERCPQAATAASVRETQVFYGLHCIFLARIYAPGAQAFQIPESNSVLRLITPRFISDAHAHNMEVHVWTVNEVADMRRLLDWGVDGIISDYPDRLMALLGRQPANI
jgi:glycerophosphoryl diester phosphodiesterase